MRLEAKNVTKVFGNSKKQRPAVSEVSVHVEEGEFLAVVGESGSGKSTLARMLLGLLRPTQGETYLDGTALGEMSKGEGWAFRQGVQCILQDPSGSLNPRKTVAKSLSEVLRLHGIAKDKRDGRLRAADALRSVALVPPEKYLDRYPHELSGGQRQRVLIARAVMLKPRVIIADEAVSALDVSAKVGILNLLQELQLEHGIGIALITHDLPAVRRVATRIVVMRHGRVVEEGEAAEILESPQQAYTRELLSAAPDLATLLEQPVAAT